MENRTKLLLASFFTLIAAGVGFAVRGAILGDWAAQYGFTKSDLGTITGGGLVGFGIIIMASSLFVDKVGYKPLLVLAFVLHLASAGITLAATPVFASSGKDAAYWCLYIGMFMFAVANGLCEAVINPLVATLYPRQKTHYLNILHAGWPGGLIVGALFAFLFCGDDARITHLRWEIPMVFFMVPTLIYGLMILRERFPHSEARAAGVSFLDMLKEFAAPVLLMLLLLHACVGYVELGTDSWITNIMTNVIRGYEVLLFIYTSAIMFILRFFAGPIVEKINPLGLLCISAILGCIGLFALGSAGTGMAILGAATIYGIGKTFLWPTMLGVVGECFPKGGAVTMGAIGGVGMLSAGLLGGPGIGYKQDYFASQNLREASDATFNRYVSPEKNRFLFFPAISGLDGAKVAVVNDNGADLNARAAKGDKSVTGLLEWWNSAKSYASTDKPLVLDAGIFGGRMALKLTAAVPFAMAIGYLLLVIYFRAKGGYKPEVLHTGDHGEQYTGGVESAAEY